MGPAAWHTLNNPAKGVPADLVILDLMLPDMDGLDVCRRIRALPSGLAQVPVLMLTAKGDAMDRIIGLEIGADDYLPKPFEARELLARIRAVLRRRGEHPQTDHVSLRFGALEIDRDARSVCIQGVPCELTSYQFDLLLTLAERAGRVLTRDQIMEAVRGRELDAFDRSIDVHMGRIRAAIETDPKAPNASSPCAVWVMCLPASKTNGRPAAHPPMNRLYIRIWLAVVLAVAVLDLFGRMGLADDGRRTTARGGGAQCRWRGDRPGPSASARASRRPRSGHARAGTWQIRPDATTGSGSRTGR
jgi:two-component system phosphate regulon response regulator OmpR